VSGAIGWTIVNCDWIWVSWQNVLYKGLNYLFIKKSYTWTHPYLLENIILDNSFWSKKILYVFFFKKASSNIRLSSLLNKHDRRVTCSDTSFHGHTCLPAVTSGFYPIFWTHANYFGPMPATLSLHPIIQRPGLISKCLKQNSMRCWLSCLRSTHIHYFQKVMSSQDAVFCIFCIINFRTMRHYLYIKGEIHQNCHWRRHVCMKLTQKKHVQWQLWKRHMSIYVFYIIKRALSLSLFFFLKEIFMLKLILLLITLLYCFVDARQVHYKTPLGVDYQGFFFKYFV
jgi:hypothetical protein